MHKNLRQMTSLIHRACLHSMRTSLVLPPEYILNSSRTIQPHELSNPEITTMKSGLKVVSMECYGAISSVGLFIKAGPRFEVFYPSGISHLISKLAFLSTRKYEGEKRNCGLSNTLCPLPVKPILHGVGWTGDGTQHVASIS